MTLKPPSQEQLNSATTEEIAELAGLLLERMPRGFLPPAVFAPIRERTRPSTLDVISFQTGTNAERVLIGQRGVQPGDKWWSGQQNIPGSVILPTEELQPIELRMADGRLVELGGARVSQDITTPADRILAKEFMGSIKRVAPVHELMRYWVDVDEIKIAENKISAWTEVDLTSGHAEVIGGAFYDTQDIIDNPPKNLVDAHEYFIERSAIALQAARA